MPFDEGLAERIRDALTGTEGVTERKMFGGICFMVNGNMALGPVNDVCMFRIGPDAYDEALAGGVARELSFTGRPMRGMVEVSNEVLGDDEALAEWVALGVAFAESLPPK